MPNQVRGELATRLEILRDELAEIDVKLDSFDFHAVETQINKQVVDDVEKKITDLSSLLYDLNHDISQLEG